MWVNNMRKKVAVFVQNMYGAMIADTQMGLREAALEKGVKLIFFSSFSDGFSSQFYNQYGKYDEGDIVSFKLPDLEDFDGVVILESSFPPVYIKRLEKLLLATDTPVINLGGVNDKFYSLITNDDNSFRAVIEHVVEEHNCKNLYHVAGSRDHDFTFDRINVFNEVLEKHGLPNGEERIYYGTLWRDCGGPAVDYILEHCRKDGCEYPDAIICANDYTAIGVVDACRERGIAVPGDVIVTGYDGIEVARMGYPSITTSEQPFADIGKNAIYTLEKLWNGENLDKVIKQDGVLRTFQSCGCVPLDINRTEEIRQLYYNRMGKMEYLAQSTTNMILSISNAPTLEDVYHEIEKNAMTDTGFDTFLLCLAPDWDKQRVITDDTVMVDEEVKVVCGFIGDEPVEPQSFRMKELLPEKLMNDPASYYICSIHHLQYYMGYIIISPRLENYNQLLAKSWLVNLGAMLENWRIRRRLNETVDRLENLYNRDMLTGLYNRRGYELFFEDIYKECLDKGQQLAVMVIDMDNLKIVNDNYGHNEGDYSLCTIAEAMMMAASTGEICLRTGGDEFVVLAKDYTEEKAKDYAVRLRENVQRRISRDKKSYKLEVSVGAYVRLPDVIPEGSSINDISEEYMRHADTEMYKEKKEHKTRAKI